MWRELCRILIPLYVTFLSASELGLTNPFVSLPQATGGTHSASAVFFLGGGTHFLVLCCGSEIFQLWSVAVISLSLQKAPVPRHSRVTWRLPGPGSLWIAVKITRIVLILCCCFWEKLNLFLLGGRLTWSWEREKEGLFALLQREYVKANRAASFQQLDRQGWRRRLYEMWIYNTRLSTQRRLIRSRDISLARVRAADADGQSLTCPPSVVRPSGSVLDLPASSPQYFQAVICII